MHCGYGPHDRDIIYTLCGQNQKFDMLFTRLPKASQRKSYRTKDIYKTIGLLD